LHGPSVSWWNAEALQVARRRARAGAAWPVQSKRRV
jgi:hypothetical protein